MQFWPLVHCRTMRFEGKYSYFKGTNRITKNKVSICQNLAYRHQMHQVIKDTITSYLDANKIQHQETYSLKLSDMQSEVRKFMRTLKEVEQLLGVKSLTYGATTYGSGLCDILGQIGDPLSFGYIMKTFLINGEHLLFPIENYSLLCSLFFFLNSWNETVVNINKLPDPHPNSCI